MKKVGQWFDEFKLSFAALLIYMSLIFFTPYFKIMGRDNFELTFAVTLVFIVFLPFTLKRFIRRENRVYNAILIILCVILISDTLSIVNYILNRGFNNITVNIVSNVKVGLYILIVISLYNLEDNQIKKERFLKVVLPLIGGILAVIGIFQYFNILNINNWFTRYFIWGEGGKILIDVLNEKQQFGRVLGTVSNPNFFSLQLVIFLVFIASNVFFNNSMKVKITNILIAMLLLLAVVLTQSRTSLLVLVIISVYGMLVQTIRGGARNILKLFIVIAIIGFFTFTIAKMLNLYYILDALKYGLKTHTFTMRFERWRDAFNLFKLHPVIGIGPVHGEYFSAVDNEYFLILRNYGIVGLLTHMSFYIYIFVVSLRDALSKNNSVILRQYAFALNCGILAVMIANITMATFYLWRNFVFVLIICGIWASMKTTKKY